MSSVNLALGNAVTMLLVALREEKAADSWRLVATHQAATAKTKHVERESEKRAEYFAGCALGHMNERCMLEEMLSTFYGLRDVDLMMLKYMKPIEPEPHATADFDQYAMSFAAELNEKKRDFVRCKDCGHRVLAKNAVETPEGWVCEKCGQHFDSPSSF